MSFHAERFHFIVCKLFFGKQGDKEPTEQRSTLSPEDKGPAPTNRDSEKTAMPLARWWVELGSLGGSVAPGRGEWEGRVCSVGQRSLDHTAEELMHHSEEGQGSSAHVPAHRPLGWCTSVGRAACRSGQVRGGWRGLLEARQQPTLLSSPLACSAGWWVQAAGAEEGCSRSRGSGEKW